MVKQSILILSALVVLSSWATKSRTTLISTALKVKDPTPSQEQSHDKDETGDDQGQSTSKCRWGEPCFNTNTSSTGAAEMKSLSTNDKSSEMYTSSVHSSTSTRLPFVKETHHVPPEGFQIDVRVYTNRKDKLAHFDDTPLQLPYFDCASTGITTSPLKIQHAYFRHFFSSSPPRFKGGEEFDHHAVLMVTLHHQPLVMELNSGESKTFAPGSVILLEDVVAGGHKCKSPDGQDVSVLLLTLPHYYSKTNFYTSSSSSVSGDGHTPPDRLASIMGNSDNNNNNRYVQSRATNCLLIKPTQFQVARRMILGALGTSFSLLLADWLGKVAPIWLSVGIGGACLVVGGTVGFVTTMESVLNEIDFYRQRQLLLETADAVGNGPKDKAADDAGCDLSES